MFFNNRRPHGNAGDSCSIIESVVRQACNDTKTVNHAWYRAQVIIGGRCWIAAYTMENCQLVATSIGHRVPFESPGVFLVHLPYPLRLRSPCLYVIYVRFSGLTIVTVEPPAARRPPHRSRRAELSHRAIRKYSRPHKILDHLNCIWFVVR